MTATVSIINGPNLNLLGDREPDIYGEKSLDRLHRDLSQQADSLNVGLTHFQSNSEGGLVDYIHSLRGKADAIIINAGAYTHTSVALLDALKGVAIPFIEVHLSNIYRRERFRHHSYLAAAAVGQISGFGTTGYELALSAAVSLIRSGEIKEDNYVS